MIRQSNKISNQLLFKSKILFLLSNIMNIIGNLFRSPSKNPSNDAKLNKQVQFFSPQKCNSHTKSQNLSQDKNCIDMSMDVSFYLQKLIQVKLGKTDIVPKTKQYKSHMVYEVWVITSDFQYKIKKRFSVFNQFYCHIKKDISHLNIVFPKKTLLVSGTNVQVVSQRYQLLNKFIKKVFTQVKQKKNTDIRVRFLSFVQIDEQYQRRKTKTFTELPKDPMAKYENIFCVQDASIAFQIRKLNDYNNHQREVLQRIESYISYRGYKLTNDDIKILLIGNPQTGLKGLLNLSLSINNEIKSLQLLRFLLDYLSPSKKTYNDKIYKQFERLPLETFHFTYESVRNNFSIIQFKKIFFVIVQLYCQNKLFTQTKILQLYPDLLAEFQLWKNLSEFNQGNLKKTSSGSVLHFEQFLRKPSKNQPQKAKSFEIHPKQCETPQSLDPLIEGENPKVSFTKSSACQDKKNQFSSFKSNDSTSQLIIEEDWELSKMKLQLNEIQENSNKMENLQSTQTYSLKTNKSNKICIQILKTSKTLQNCQQLSKTWNKLIYDQRYDQFTGISRIYIKLNGKSKIFKYRQEDEKVEVKSQNFILISKRRLESYNSITKSEKQNIEEALRIKVNNPSNGFEEVIKIENIIQSADFQEQRKEPSFRKVTIEMNFEGEEEYFRSEIQGLTSSLIQYAIQAFLN